MSAIKMSGAVIPIKPTKSRYTSIRLNLALLFTLISIAVTGQTNTVKLLTDLGTNYDYAHSIALQEDGKVVIAGDAYGTPCMIRFDTTGIQDASFGVGGKLFANWDCGSNPADNDIQIQKDGKILMGTSYYNGSDVDFILARYHADGFPDASFGVDGKTILPIGSYNDWCNVIALQPDGKILAAGGASEREESNDHVHFALVRFNAEGGVDSTFGNQGTVITKIGQRFSHAYSMALQPDHKIILAGKANDSLCSDFVLVRYHADGRLDDGFGLGGILRTSLSETCDFAESVVLQADGKIVVAGSSESEHTSYDVAMARFLPDGSPDSTFGVDGITLSDFGIDFGTDLVLQPDGKLLITGTSAIGAQYDFVTLRYLDDGTPDADFGTNGLIRTSFGNHDSSGEAMVIGEDGEIIVAGTYNQGSPKYFDFATVRLFSSLPVGGVEKEMEQFSGTLSPNPVDHHFTLHYSLKKSQKITILLRDLQGRVQHYLLAEKPRLAGDHMETFQLDHSVLPGTCFVEIRSLYFNKSFKILVL